MHKTINAFDHKIAYRLTGDPLGKPVMLIHGYAEDGRVWDHQIEFLKTTYRLIIPDLPGCGASDPLGNDSITLETCASILAAILDQENIPAATLIGHSMGGYITLAFIEKFQHRLTAAGFFHSTALADSEEKKNMRRKSMEFIRKNGSAPFIRQSTPNLFSEYSRSSHPQSVEDMIDRYAAFDPQSLIAYYEAMIARPDRTNLLAGFTKPFLFIAGREDNAVPLASLLPQTYLPTLSYIHILDKVGHLGMLESPAKTTLILDQFLHSNHIYHE